MRLNLRKRRRELGLTQQQLGEMIQLSGKLISALELGRRNGSLDAWDKLEEALKTDQKVLRRICDSPIKPLGRA